MMIYMDKREKPKKNGDFIKQAKKDCEEEDD